MPESLSKKPSRKINQREGFKFFCLSLGSVQHSPLHEPPTTLEVGDFCAKVLKKLKPLFANDGFNSLFNGLFRILYTTFFILTLIHRSLLYHRGIHRFSDR